MRQHKTKYIQRIEQLILSHVPNSYSESMQPPLHKQNSVQGIHFFTLAALSTLLFASTFDQYHAFEASANVVQIGFRIAPSIVHPNLWISYLGNFVFSMCTHMLKVI